jgi:flagellar basal body-associated protein FliL
MENQNGSIILCLMVAIACASIYAVSYYVCNSDDKEEEPAPVEQIDIYIKTGNFLEPEDKFLFT